MLLSSPVFVHCTHTLRIGDIVKERETREALFMPNLPGVREKTSDEKKKKFLRRIAYKGGKR